MKYRQKDVTVEAMQFTDDHPDVLIPIQKFMGTDLIVSYRDPSNVCILIENPDETMRAYIGDYIVKGEKGKIYACSKDTFEQTYKAVTECEDAK